MPWIMTSNGSSAPYVKIGFKNNAFLWSSCHRLSFWTWCSCNIEGILSVGWKTMKSTVDFHFFDIANHMSCIAFLLNFWTLQRSFCIGKLPFDTSIYIRPDFLRYLLDGRGYLFLQISLQPSDRWRSYCNFPVCDLLPFYVRTTKRAYNKILLGNKIVFGCANFPSNSSLQQNYPSV